MTDPSVSERAEQFAVTLSELEEGAQDLFKNLHTLVRELLQENAELKAVLNEYRALHKVTSPAPVIRIERKN